MQSLILAIQFLTRIPTPQVRNFSPALLAGSARWFPLVGLLLGGLLAGVAWAAAQVDPWLAAWVAMLVWVAITGGLHLDGLADVADALGAAHRDRERLLAVMKDPHLGSFGVLTLIVTLAGKLVLLMLLARGGHWLALVLIPAWARLGPLFWQTLPSLSPGYGEQFGWQLPRRARWIWLLLLLAFSAWMQPLFLLAPLAIWLFRRWLQKALGGMNGDCLGAGIEVMELGLLLLAGMA